MPKPTQANSLFDILVRLMPEIRTLRKQQTDPSAAKSLYALWSNASAKVSDKTYRRPTDIRQAEVDTLKRAELVTLTGENIKITQKGADVIKQMILGDDRSAFDDDGRPIDYIRAIANLSPNGHRKQASALGGVPATAAIDEASGGNWYTRMKHAHKAA